MCTLSKELLLNTVGSRAKFSDYLEDPKHATGLYIKKMLIKHNMEMKVLGKVWMVESNFWLSQVGEGGQRRMKSSVLKLLPSASVHVTLAEAAEKLRAGCAHGACSSSWAFVFGSRSTQWVATLVSGAPNLPDTTGAKPVAVSHQSDATPEVTVGTLVLLLQGRRVLWRGRRPCECLPERLLAFDTKGGRTVLFACPARLIDKNGMYPLVAAHQIVSVSLCAWLQMGKRVAFWC